MKNKDEKLLWIKNDDLMLISCKSKNDLAFKILLKYKGR